MGLQYKVGSFIVGCRKRSSKIMRSSARVARREVKQAKPDKLRGSVAVNRRPRADARARR